MAVGLFFDGVGVTQAQYEQVLNEVNPDGRVAKGVLYHAAGPSEQGWRVMEVWENQADLDRFFQERLGAALQRSGINVQPSFFEVTTIRQP